MSAGAIDVLQALAEDALAMTATRPQKRRPGASGPVVMRKARGLRPGDVLLCRERIGHENTGRLITVERQVRSVRRTWDPGILRIVVDGSASPVHIVHENTPMRVVTAGS